MRFCVDYRKLNNLTERDVYPLPRLDECIDSLGDAVVFSTLDANSGYWQVSMHPDDRDKTTLTCHVGTFRFKRMPFGLRNAPSTFQRVMDVIISGIRWQK
jgi:Reverse transcriptase (RNA-dependent DNA polymerase)